MKPLSVVLALLPVWSLTCSVMPAQGADGIYEPLGFAPRARTKADYSITITQGGTILTPSIFLSAVDNNYPRIDAADSRRRVASARRMEVQGVFDPVIRTLNGYAWMQNTSKFDTLKRVIYNQPAIEIPTRSGISLLGTYRFNPRTSQSPYIETGFIGEFGGGVAVPLLRGFIINERETNEKLAKIGEPVATQAFSLNRLDILLRANIAYWNWVGAQRKMQVARRLVQLSEFLVSAADKRSSAGDLPKIQVTEAEEDFQRRTADKIAAELEFKKATYELAVYLFDSSGRPAPFLDEMNVPQLWPTPQEFTAAEIDESVKKAVDRRPELKRIALEKEQAKLQLKLARNDLLPQADALATYGYDGGISGVGNVFRTQVTFSSPLYLRNARGRIKSAHFNIDALNAEEISERQRLVAEVMSAAATLNASHQKFLAVTKQVEKSEAVYVGEKKRFNFGDSTVFLVTQRERQLFDAKIKLVDAQVEYLQASAKMQALTCTY
jgi:outer membrane protein TolC